MAGKTHVDNLVAERRLRPIYDWLDNGNNKKAIQEAEKVLKKQPNFLCAKILKGLALLRLGKDEDCEQILEAVRTEAPSDDSTLQAMAICYRELHQPHRICEVYEAAAKKDPTNEELITHLFMSYVRIADYKRQQQTALALYKLKPKNPYYFWAVMSVVMQAYKADETISKAVTLPLAERMVQKLVNEGKIEAEQEVQLYIMILEMQGKWSEALNVLNGPLGEKLVSYVIVPLKRAQLHMKLKNWREANHIYKELLLANIDHWAYYMEYFTSAFNQLDCLETNSANDQTDSNGVENDIVEASEGDSTVKETFADGTVEMCIAFVKRMQDVDARTETRAVRGPSLAMLELYRRVAERGGDAQVVIGDIVDMIMGYVRRFGDKPCCVSDLKPFLALIPEPRRADFLHQVTEHVGLADGAYASSAEQMLRHITSVQLARCLGGGGKDATAVRLMAHYEHGFAFTAPSSVTEFGANDAYGLLAAHALYDLWCETNNSEHLLEALLVLEHVLNYSPANFHCKLLKLRFYQLLGAGSAAHRVYDLLDVKHMQLDSMGYYHCNHLYITGQIMLAGQLCDHTLKFFTSNYKDSIDHLTFSYKFGSFLKIEEFVEFRERLNNSFHYAYCSVEKMLMELVPIDAHASAVHMLRAMAIEPAKDTIRWDSLQDNRDLNVVVSWDPPHKQVADNGRSESFAVELQFLRVRSLLLRCIAAAFEIGTPQHEGKSSTSLTNGDSETSNLSVLTQLTQELKAHFDAIHAKPLPDEPKNIICLPLPSRFRNYILSVPSAVVVEMLTAVRCCAEEDEAGLAECSANAAEWMLAMVGKVAAVPVNVQVGEGCDLHDRRRDDVEFAVLVVEVLSYTTALLGVCHGILKPQQVSLVKKVKSKKKKETTGNQERLTRMHGIHNELVENVVDAADKLSTAFADWEKITSSYSLSAEFNLITLVACDRAVTSKEVRSKLMTYVLDQVNSSHIGALKELGQIVLSKIKYLNSVKV